MILFFASVGFLLLGYIIYGRVVERLFGADPERATPAERLADGVDYVKMPPWKIFLIQLLNIAGLGPIYGAVLGALYGPVALLWIVFGCIFAGAVHDYFSGMLSVRYDGQSIPDVVGRHLGNGCKQFMRAFSVVLLILVGVVFFLGPAALLESLTGMDKRIWTGIIIAYYFLATIMPVDKIIGRIYPLFGAVLIFMAVGTITMLMVRGYELYPIKSFQNLNPQDLPMWPLMFITIACGAISGFHATQSPMMARCLPSESQGRPVFYGAMIAEGVIALVWATLAISFFPSPEQLNQVLGEGGPGLVVNRVSISLLGGVGGVLAIIGVVVLPVTSGDTAFRSARLIVCDMLKIPQQKASKRLAVAVPLFAAGCLISLSDFGLIWRYFGWANQTLAVFVLWTAAVYLAEIRKFHWVATLPALFMTAVVTTFIANSTIGFNLPMPMATRIGLGAAAVTAGWFFWKVRRLVRVPGVAVICCLLLAGAVTAAAQDYSGSWTGVITESVSDCKGLGKAKPGTYRLTFSQEGDLLTAMENTAGRPYRGAFEPGDIRRVVVRATYPETGGYVTEEVTLEFQGDGTGRGSSRWRWSDGWLQCGGSFRFSLKKDPAP